MKVIAEVNWSKVLEATTEETQKLRSTFSFQSPGVFWSNRFKRLSSRVAHLDLLLKKGKWDGKTCMISKGGVFPTGLLGQVTSLISSEVIDNRFIGFEAPLADARIRAKSLKLAGVTTAEHQTACLEAGLTSGRAIFKLATNAGKSEVVCLLAQALNLPALWLVGRNNLLYQAADRWKLRTGTEAGLVGDGKRTFGDIMTIGSVQSLTREDIDRFDVLFVDEAMHAQSVSWYKICMEARAPFRFGLTGTLPTDQLKLHRIIGATGDVAFEKTNAELIGQGWSAKPTIHLQELSYPINRLEYKQAYDRMVRFHVPFAQEVAREAERWYRQGKAVLIIVDRKAQLANITSRLLGLKVRAKSMQGGGDGERDKALLGQFRSGKVRVLVATSVLDEGVDVPAINVLILAAGGLSASRQAQRFGRALRKKSEDNRCDIIDYIPNGNKHLLKHGLERIAQYEREGFEIVWRESAVVF